MLVKNLVSLCCALSAAIAADNAVLTPAWGTVINSKQNFHIEWTPSSQNTVDLILREGSPDNLEKRLTIVSGIPNTGSYTWMIPEDVPTNSDYSIEIRDSGTRRSNFSPYFTILSGEHAQINAEGDKVSSGSIDPKLLETAGFLYGKPLPSMVQEASAPTGGSIRAVASASQHIFAEVSDSLSTSAYEPFDSAAVVHASTTGSSGSGSVTASGSSSEATSKSSHKSSGSGSSSTASKSKSSRTHSSSESGSSSATATSSTAASTHGSNETTSASKSTTEAKSGSDKLQPLACGVVACLALIFMVS